MRKMHKGGITVFTVLALTLIIGCLLTMLEGARSFELRSLASYRTKLAIEGAFANYNSCLWENYHLLGCNLQQMQGIITAGADGAYEENVPGSNLLLLKTNKVELEEYTLLTDGNGAVYINAVSAYMSQNLLYETAKAIYNQYQSIKELIENHSINGTEIDNALKCLEDLKKDNRGGNERNPLEVIQKLQKTQLLELVVPDTDKLANGECDLAEAVSHRTLQTGKNSRIEENDWLDRVYLQQYLLTYLSDYTHTEEGRGFCYELEYLVGGKDGDIANLRTVVNQLLLIREAANLAYLLSDVEKMQMVQGLALALAGFSGNGWVIEIVKLGIIAAWAFGESVLDVRALLQGKKIPLIKNAETWTLDLESLGNISEDYMVAEECDYGVTYKTYLGVMLLFQKDEGLAYRAMDVQEMTLQKAAGAVKLDQLVVQAKVKVQYRYAPVFASLPDNMAQGEWSSKVLAEAAYGYY